MPGAPISLFDGTKAEAGAPAPAAAAGSTLTLAAKETAAARVD